MARRIVLFPTAIAFAGVLLGMALLPLSAQAKKGKKYALLVGVTDYKNATLNALKFTENDVEELATILQSRASGFDEVRVLSNTRGKKNSDDAPTAANIKKAITALVRKKERHDTILIGLSGHGVQLEVKDPDGKARAKTYPYFCPVDADFLGVSYSTGRSDSLVLLDDLFSQVGKCGATNRLVLIDACRNEVKAESSTRNVDVDQVTVPRGVGVLFSCKSGERAWETKKLGKGHGVFFYHVVQGLKGEAKNKRGQVTWDSLASYVRTEVAEVVPGLIGGNAEQTPHGILNLDSLPVLAVIRKEDVGKEPIVKKSANPVTNSIGMKLIYIKPGEFKMGSPKAKQDAMIAATEKFLGSKLAGIALDRYRSEGPVHEVEITKGFYMGVYEVTQGEYEKVMGKNPSEFSANGSFKAMLSGVNTARLPVENVTYLEAEEFCKKLSAKATEKGRTYRLPTEAQWEYACRAGTTTATHFGDSLSNTKANISGDHPLGGAEKGKSKGRPSEVGSYTANDFGLYDMHGNVNEWCSDWYDELYYTKGPNSDPQGPEEGTKRVLRGGSWRAGGDYCRSANRFKYVPKFTSDHYGFRVVCTTLLPFVVPPPPQP